MANRFDISTTKKWSFDKRGRLIVEATPTRSGVFKYIDEFGKTVRELRHPDEVFSQETLDSLNIIPYTTQENHISLMTPENIRERTYGTTMSGAKRVDNHAEIKLKINDGKEIEAIMSGKSLELSNGYTCDVIAGPGTFEGEKYDARQTNIVYDHVARVEKARGGESCRIRLDSQSAISGIGAERLDSGNLKQSTGEIMADPIKEILVEREFQKRESGDDFRLDSFSITIDKSQKGDIDRLKNRDEEMFSEIQRLNTELTKKTVKMDFLETENKKLSGTVKGSISKEKFEQEIEKRTNLHSLAKNLGIKDYKGISISDLNKKTIEASGVFTELKMDNAEWVNFAIEHLQTKHARNVMKSRKNLESSVSFKFDNSEDDLAGESELEMAS